MIYLENCQIPDVQLAQMLTALGQSSKLKEIHLINMVIAPNSTKTIFLLLKNRALHKNEFSISFRESTFLNLRQMTMVYPNEPTHALLSAMLVPIIHLSMVN